MSEPITIGKYVNRIVMLVDALAKVEPELDKETLLECVLSTNPAGPITIERARDILGIESSIQAAARAMGRLGGSRKSPAKTAAVRRNALKGGKIIPGR